VSNSLPQDLPVGDLRFYDNYVPALDAGNWRIEVAHAVTEVDTGALGAKQEFVISAPQFAVDPAVIVSFYPPDSSVGLYGQTLPYVLLADAMLPWERRMNAPGRAPWLAVLVVREDELIGGAGSSTRAQIGTVAGFLAPDTAVLKPAVQKEGDVDGGDPCGFIQIPTALFTQLTARLDELQYLAHCRQSNIADKAHMGLERNGMFSTVVANRFPAVPDAGAAPLKSIAHLVSLEGLERWLVDQPNFGGHTSVALVSLASWTFQTLPNNQEDFRGLMEAIVAKERDGTRYKPDNLLLRLPTPALNESTPSGVEAARRIREGFVPLQYQLRTGEQTLAWYRGPLSPVLTAQLPPTRTFPTADSALIYHSRFGVFDVSLATAWEAGRALALADRGFGQTLFDFRRRGHQLTDALLHRLRSDAFSASQIADVSHDSTVQDEILRILDDALLNDIGATPVSGSNLPPHTDTDPGDPKAAVQNFLSEPDVQQRLRDLIKDDLDLVANWLARLLLLYPVPFHLLVPDGRMLEMETLRFFYLDNNWLRALHDGAVSIGMESSRATMFQGIIGDLIFRSALDAARIHRSTLIGVDPPPAEMAENLISGFLLRSAVVSGWPNLAVRGGKKDGTSLKILRMDHVASNLLLGLFWGVPDFIEFAEPQESFRFGIDDDGMIPLRQPVAGLATPLGKQLTPPFKVFPTYLRSAASRVLRLAPAADDGLLQQLRTALNTPTEIISTLGSSDFALQMIKSPEAIRFTTQAS
jgi:hypothetical protein